MKKIRPILLDFDWFIFIHYIDIVEGSFSVRPLYPFEYGTLEYLYIFTNTIFSYTINIT